MTSLVKNLIFISRLHIHYYPNRRYKSYTTSLKAGIVGQSLISGLVIDRILYFVFYDKILQIYRQHWVRKFYRHILSKYRQIFKKWGEEGVTPPLRKPPLDAFLEISGGYKWHWREVNENQSVENIKNVRINKVVTICLKIKSILLNFIQLIFYFIFFIIKSWLQITSNVVLPEKWRQWLIIYVISIHFSGRK